MKLKLHYPAGATPLDPNELDGLKHRHIKTQEQLNQLEQANLDQAQTWLKRKRRPDILSDVFACELHRQMFGDVWSWAGHFRTTEKSVGDVKPIQIPVSLRQLMDDAKYWHINGVYKPLEAAVRLHHRLTVIHPFPNGNGRHARVMADAVLEKTYGVDRINWAGGTELKDNGSRRTEYISALKSADGEDFGLLFKFVGLAG